MPQVMRSRKDILLSAPFYIGLAALYIKTCFSIISLVELPDAVDDALLVIGIVFLLIHCLIKRKVYGYKLILFAVILVVLLYGYTRSGETAPLTVALVIIAAASIDNIKPLIKLWFIVTLAFFLIMACAYALIALFDPDDLQVYHRTSAGVPGRARYSLGFVHPNMASALLMMLCAAYLYLNYERLSYSHYIAVAVSSIIVFALTYSFTSFILTILVMILFFVQKRWQIFQRKVLNICTSLLPIALFIAVFLVSGPLFSQSISGFLTGRVMLWYVSMTNLGMTIFGQPFMETQLRVGNLVRHVTTLDSFYAEGLIVYGLFFCVLFCWLYWRRIRYMDTGFSAQISVLVLLVLFGITEVQVTCLTVSFPALIMLSRGIDRRYPITKYQGDKDPSDIEERFREAEEEPKETPLVSAVVLTHNRKDLAVKAVQSVLNQTYKPMEIIVVDDASTDGTAEAVRSLADEFGFQFIAIPESETKGGNHARNMGILAAQGTYVAFLDDDDEWMPEKIAKQVSLLEKHPVYGICYCGQIVDHYSGAYQTANDVSQLKDGDLSTDIFIKGVCNTSMMIVQRSLLLDVGMFDEDLRYWQDNELCMRLFQKSQVGVVREHLVLYREVKDDAERLSNNVMGWEQAVEQIYAKHAAEMNALTPAEIRQRDENRYKNGARKCHMYGDKKRQKAYLRKVFGLSHSPKDLIKYVLNTTSIKESFGLKQAH